MNYAQLNPDNTLDRLIDHDNDVVWDATHQCPASKLTPDEAIYFRVVEFVHAAAPAHDPLTQGVREAAPALLDGTMMQQWDVFALEPEQIEVNQLAKAEAEAKVIADKIEALWAAADRYTSGYISGVAIGILTIGVMQQKPKALAVSAWSSAVWVEYYVRKALVTATSTDDHDFSGFGPIPYSVPELQAEVGI